MERLQDHLVAVCSDAGYLDGILLATPDIDAAWDRLASDYFGDAVKEFNGFPEYTLACAGFLGMAVAHLWDADLPRFNACTYADFLGPRGFDDMDDFITGTLLQATPGDRVNAPANVGDAEAPGVAAMQTCAGEAYHFLMRDSVEPGTATAYRLFVASAAVMFRLGAAIELRRLGYMLELLPLSGRG